MHVVHISHSYYPVLGGKERALQRLTEELVKLGHEVHIITAIHGAEHRPREEVLNGVYIHRVRSWKLCYPDLMIPREAPRDVIERADIVHGWSQNSYFTYKVCREAKKLGKPVIMYFLGVDYLKHHYNPFIRLFGYPYQKWITKKIVKITDLALVTNEYEKKLLKEKYGINAVVLPHGIDEIYLRLPNMAKYFRERYSIESRIIAYVGRLHPTKGLDLLIKAFAEVVKQVPDTILVVAGKGDEKYLKECMKLAKKLGIENKIKYLDYVPENDKIALIDVAEVIVLPSKHAGESYPLIISEVIARQKMIITTCKGTLPYLGESIIVVEPRVHSLANTIIHLLTKQSYAKQIKYLSLIHI